MNGWEGPLMIGNQRPFFCKSQNPSGKKGCGRCHLNLRSKSCKKLFVPNSSGRPDDPQSGPSLDRLNAGIAQVLDAMRRGAALHLEYRPQARWCLSNGTEVSADVARRVIERRDVAAVGSGLFGFTPVQTFRYVEDLPGPSITEITLAPDLKISPAELIAMMTEFGITAAKSSANNQQSKETGHNERAGIIARDLKGYDNAKT
jgi:hypothetical protein